MASVAQIRANRLNAQKSTGPRTPEGKAVVAQNAVKHGLLAQQVVIRGEDPGEFELFRGRMVQDLDPAGSLESLLAERVAHLGWRLRRAERLDRAAWTTLETDHAAREASTPPALRRSQGETQDDEETVLARVVVDDFGRAKLLDRLLGYERRIENSLYRTVGELQKCKKWHEREAVRAEADMDGSAGVVRGAGREGERFFAPTKNQDGLRSSEEGGRGRPLYEEASGDATTNGAGPVGPSCETKPNGVSSLKCEVSSKQSQLPGSAGAAGLAASTSTLETGDESPNDVTTNGARAEERFGETKPMEVTSGKFEVSSEETEEASPPGLPASDGALQTANGPCDMAGEPG